MVWCNVPCSVWPPAACITTPVGITASTWRHGSLHKTSPLARTSCQPSSSTAPPQKGHSVTPSITPSQHHDIGTALPPAPQKKHQHSSTTTTSLSRPTPHLGPETPRTPVGTLCHPLDPSSCGDVARWKRVRDGAAEPRSFHLGVGQRKKAPSATPCS